MLACKETAACSGTAKLTAWPRTAVRPRISGSEEGIVLPEAMLLDLGLVEYRRAHDLQLRLNLLRQAGRIPDAVLMLEHPPCITLGRVSRPENILV